MLKDKFILERRFKALGTDIYIGIVISGSDEERAVRDMEGAEKIYREKEKILSRFDKNSELSRLNKEKGIFVWASQDVLRLAEKSLKYYSETDGLFDPRVVTVLENMGYREDFKKNTFDEEYFEGETLTHDLNKDLKIDGEKVFFGKRMDFAGLAKGYVTDKVAEFLRNEGWKDFLVDSGGDMFASGLNDIGEKWGISLENYKEGNEVLVRISDEGIATSGMTRKNWKIGGKKVHHLINPKNISNFGFDIKSVTVLDKNTERADVTAKTLFLMGAEKGIKFSNKKNIRSAFLLKDNNIIFSDNFK